MSARKTAVVYGSLTRSGNTMAVATRLQELLRADLHHVDDLNAALLAAYALVVFLTPTAGNEELAEPFERFFDQPWVDLSGIRYVVCELGNYYGYDLFEYGAAKVLKGLAASRGGTEFFPTLSLDSLPLIDWELFGRWALALQEKVACL